MYFKVILTPQKQSFKVEFNGIGRHNILNALAAIGVACELDIGR
jgi:UDP-N-acetylmuramate--alanine ligase